MKTIEYDPATHVLVPREASMSMLIAAEIGTMKWAAILAAAPAAPAQPVHNDHPMRHWDRTCPACIAQPVSGEPVPDTDIDTLRRDAERYRLLRERSHSHYFAYRNYKNGFNGSFSQASGTGLDQYIDKASQAKETS